MDTDIIAELTKKYDELKQNLTDNLNKTANDFQKVLTDLVKDDNINENNTSTIKIDIAYFGLGSFIFYDFN